MMHQSVILAILVSLCLQAVYGYPSGPPVGSVKGLCEAMDPTGHGPSKATGDPPYVISVSSSSYKANANITVSIKVTGDSEHFEGLFVQARRQDASKGSTTEALGTFSDQPTDTQLLHCGNAKNNAWGHKDKKTKTEKTITWTAPDDQGPLVFVATIVKGPKEMYWMDVKSSELTFDAGEKKLHVNTKWDDFKQRLYYQRKVANQP
ncbi:putative defense protein 3 [Amphiura filiformis]|uniref:putative defense protein 3 n=1 Tax=Amphiura filiformis TaxID=82378 RepID=UPI003B216725